MYTFHQIHVSIPFPLKDLYKHVFQRRYSGGGNPSNSSVSKIFELLVLCIVCMLRTIEKELVRDLAYGASTATFSTLSIVGICDDIAQCLQKDILLAD
jgi:hypothetical protein